MENLQIEAFEKELLIQGLRELHSDIVKTWLSWHDTKAEPGLNTEAIDKILARIDYKKVLTERLFKKLSGFEINSDEDLPF